MAKTAEDQGYLVLLSAGLDAFTRVCQEETKPGLSLNQPTPVGNWCTMQLLLGNWGEECGNFLRSFCEDLDADGFFLSVKFVLHACNLEQSDWLCCGFTLAQQCADLASVLGSLSLRQVVLWHFYGMKMLRSLWPWSGRGVKTSTHAGSEMNWMRSKGNRHICAHELQLQLGCGVAC